MTTQNFLTDATAKLTKAGIITARLDALVLLGDYLQKDRAHILAHPEIELHDDAVTALSEQVNARIKHTPLAYIRGKTEFYGHEFVVTQNVLEPRPESETMIELLKNLLEIENMTIIDVGTGSGALAVTAKLEIPSCNVIAIDIDRNCLAVARRSANKHKVTVTCLQGDLVEPLTTNPPVKPYILLCNLPYVPDDFRINEAARHEPKLAIFGGHDGLDLFRRMFNQISTLQHKPQCVLTESLPVSHDALAEIANQHGYQQSAGDDFIQVFEYEH